MRIRRRRSPQLTSRRRIAQRRRLCRPSSASSRRRSRPPPRTAQALESGSWRRRRLAWRRRRPRPARHCCRANRRCRWRSGRRRPPPASSCCAGPRFWRSRLQMGPRSSVAQPDPQAIGGSRAQRAAERSAAGLPARITPRRSHPSYSTSSRPRQPGRASGRAPPPPLPLSTASRMSGRPAAQKIQTAARLRETTTAGENFTRFSRFTFV